MNSQIKMAFALIGLGASLVIYAHSTFQTKGMAKLIYGLIIEVKSDIKELNQKVDTLIIHSR